MAHQKPHLLTEAELRRFEDCADENAKLADCWAGHQIAVVACEPSDAYMYTGQRNSQAIRMDILSSAENPARSGSRSREQRPPSRQLSRRTIRMLQRPKVDKKLQPKPWYFQANSHEVFDLYSDEAKAKAQETFDELSAAHATVCIVSHDMRETTRAMEAFGVRVPAKTVFVDLIKVLEHQARDEGIPEELRMHTDENVVVRHGRYERRPGTLVGYYGMPNMKLLEVLGPAAESRRTNFKKMERGNIALSRIAGRIRMASA